jgi:hypothetical protein
MGDKAAVIIMGYHCCQLKFGHILITDHIFFLHSSDNGERMGVQLRQNISQLFVDFKKSDDSVRREVLYSILIQFEGLMILFRLIKMCSNETYIKFRHLYDPFRMQNYLKQGDALSSLLFSFFFRTCHEKRSGNSGATEINLETSAAGLF